MKKNSIRIINALLAIILPCLVLFSIWHQFKHNEEMSAFYMTQRLAMLGVAVGALLNLRFGIHTAHYGISLLSSVLGGAIALRQIGMHFCPCFVPFGEAVLGMHLYTWAFIIFAASTFLIALLLFFYKQAGEKAATKKMGALEVFSIAIVLIVAAACAITTFQVCGLTTCA